jgi:hypothetical protein
MRQSRPLRSGFPVRADHHRRGVANHHVIKVTGIVADCQMLDIRAGSGNCPVNEHESPGNRDIVIDDMGQGTSDWVLGGRGHRAEVDFTGEARFKPVAGLHTPPGLLTAR